MGTWLRLTLRILIGAALLLVCLEYSFLAYHTEPYIQPQFNRSGSIMDQARSAMNVQLGRKSLNMDFVKNLAISLVTGILSLVTFLGGSTRGAMSPASHRRYRSDTKQIRQMQQRYKNTEADFTEYEDYAIAFDTNILLDKPEIIMDASRVSNIVISKQVVAELDGKKKDESTRSNALQAFVYLDRLHASGRLSIVNYKREVMLGHDLDEQDADQRIIGAYLGEQQHNGRNVLFVSRDRLAKMYARNVGLQVYEF